MKQTLITLIRLQACDRRIQEIQNRQADAPARLRSLEEALQAEESALGAELEYLEARKKARRALEREIDELEQKAIKAQRKLTQIKSNKEYQAALKEIDDLKYQKTGLEDRVLEIMEEMETLEARAASARKRIKQAKAHYKEDHRRLQAELSSLAKELEGLQAKRSRLCQGVEPKWLQRYEAIRAHKEGLAVSPVIKEVCQACHLGIPPQKFRELIRCEDLMSCPNCKRIIYWGEDKELSAVQT